MQSMDGAMWGRNDVISCDAIVCMNGIGVFKWKDFLYVLIFLFIIRQRSLS